MTEYDLFNAIGEIDSSFIKNAEKKPLPLLKEHMVRGGAIRNKKITFAVIAVALVFVICGGIVTYKQIHKKDNVSGEEVGSTVRFTVPEGISKIVIEDTSTGVSGTLTTAEDISEFCEKMNGLFGTVQKSTGADNCRYVVHFYKDDTEVITYSFLSQSLICERIGSEEKTVAISVGGEEIPLYDFVEFRFIQSQVKTENVVDPVLAFGEVGHTYMVLEGLTASPETLRMQEDVHGRPLYIDYVKVSCAVRYTNHPEHELFTINDVTGEKVLNSLYDITDIYIPADAVQEFTSHDKAMIRVIRRSIDDHYMFFAVCDEDANIEYLPIDEGVLRISDGQNLEHSMAFSPLFILNNYLDEVESSLSLGREPSEAEGKLPKQKFSNGMSLLDIIDYFEAFNAWADCLEDIDDSLID